MFYVVLALFDVKRFRILNGMIFCRLGIDSSIEEVPDVGDFEFVRGLYF